MFGVQPTHLILIAIAALILFGPHQLPEWGRGLGRAITEFKRSVRDVNTVVNDSKSDEHTV